MDQRSPAELLEIILADTPKLHVWEGEWNDGGLTDPMLRSLFDMSSIAAGSGVILETGAGLSTLMFMVRRPKRLITIAPNVDLRDRIFAQVARLALDRPEIEYHVDRSENVLPDLAKVVEPYVDVALIDGGHGMPTVFVDFCYINKILKMGGCIAIDDTQLHSVNQLCQLLRHQPGFDVVVDLGKLVVFRKTHDKPFLPDWTKQPFVVLESRLGGQDQPCL